MTRLLSTVAVATLALTLSACSLTGGGGADHVARQVPAYDAATFFDTTRVFGSSFSADEKSLLVSSDETGVFNVYRLDLETGERQALTQSKQDATFAVSYFPHDDRFLYSADQGGNELTHVYVQELDGQVVDLTPGDQVKASFAGWAQDLKSFWVTSNVRDPRFFDLYRYQLTDGYPRELVFENSGYQISGVSRDGRYVALVKVRNNADNDIYMWDASSPTTAPKHITPHEGNVSHGVATFDPDSKFLYYMSDADSEWTRVWSYELASGKHELVHEADWDVSYFRFSWDGQYRVVGVNADARTEVEITEASSGRPVEIGSLPAGNIGGVNFSRSGQRMVFALGRSTTPSNLHILDLADQDCRRLTENLSPQIDEENLVLATNVRYKSFDGLEIPALLYRPHSSSPDDRAPALVRVHGGPGGQSRDGYNEDIQFLVNHGYAVLAVNNRGSSGYGKTFNHLDDRRHGEDDLQDCIYGRRYLETLPWVDGDRVGIIGGSYGGYMVVAALAFEPEAFDVGIDIFGVTNWLRTLESVPAWWESFREYLYAELGDPATDRERLKRISPLFHADRIVKPLLVVQGANDPRVLKVESDEIVAAVRKNDVAVEYVVFEDEGHGFRNRDNRIEAARAYRAFLGQHLDPPLEP